jgi:hypothetical protein
MKISYIITINPVIPIDYLNALINSLNLQSCKEFDVIFYNQTRNNEAKIFSLLHVTCDFKYKFFSIEDRYFLGKYPIWDLYGFHQFLLDNDLVNDYFMCLHMEEFFDPDYTEKVLDVLDKNDFDIILGNLHQTKYFYHDVKELTNLNNAASFSNYLKQKEIDESIKWGLPSKPFFISRSPKNVLKNFKKLNELKWKKQFDSTENGFSKIKNYLLEDIFIMSKEFANKYQWYNSKIKLYFEDIHVNFSLEYILKKITQFPVYFNKSKVYHLKHKKFYYQIEDEEFSTKMLEYKTNNPVLNALKESINLYRANNNISVQEAVRLSRKNEYDSGTADINYSFHLENIREALN